MSVIEPTIVGPGTLSGLEALLAVLYIGPGAAVPIITGIGGILGFILLLWGRIVDAVGWVRGRIRGQQANDEEEKPPEDAESPAGT